MSPADDEDRAGAERAARDVIAIDGPAGAGKSTTALAVARRLGFVYLDSGAIYRALAVSIAQAQAGARGEDVTGEPPESAYLARFLEALRMEIVPARDAFRILVDGREVTAELRSPGVDELASRLATLPLVRQFVGRRLREVAMRQPAVAEGRDMGTAVFPDARLKIFLTASLDERARRRREQLQASGVAVEEEVVRNGIDRRDQRDREREASPLRPAADAVTIDNSRLSFEEQVELIVAFHRGKGRLPDPFCYHVARLASRLIHGLLFGLRTNGAERQPRGAFLLASNHKSYLDPPLLGAATPGPIGFLAKEELFRVPLLGAVIRILGATSIRRGAADRRGLEEALRRLAHGIPLVVFPEGTRIPGRSLGEPHPGIALLARRAGVPVVPARICGSDHPWRALVRRPPVRVLYGAPLAPPPAGGTAAARDFARSVMAAIAALEPPEQG